MTMNERSPDRAAAQGADEREGAPAADENIESGPSENSPSIPMDSIDKLESMMNELSEDSLRGFFFGGC
jgi:hypothetical protein